MDFVNVSVAEREPLKCERHRESAGLVPQIMASSLSLEFGTEIMQFCSEKRFVIVGKTAIMFDICTKESLCSFT